jgi:hypothetical protein
MTPPDEAKEPRRKLNKQEAVRHLLHCAIRLVMKEEDPFAIHLIVQSADKLLIDIATAKNKVLRMDWEIYIKDEYHNDFFNHYRATYNYFKHAKKDIDDELPVHDIAMINILGIFMCAANYTEIFKETTDHTQLFAIFIQAIFPNWIKAPKQFQSELLKNIASIQSMTPRLFFAEFEKQQTYLRKFYPEVSEDLQDVASFYNTSFASLRNGERYEPKRLIIRSL